MELDYIIMLLIEIGIFACVIYFALVANKLNRTYHDVLKECDNLWDRVNEVDSNLANLLNQIGPRE